jgi:membrane-bound metal-dependent hydrolase YbcI (DUF457 family)
MASFRGHLLVGTLVGTLFALMARNILLIPLYALYSILPDIDIRTSHTFKWYVIIAMFLVSFFVLFPDKYTITLLGYTFPLRYTVLPVIIFLVVLQFIQHREFFHSIAAGILLALPWYYFLGLIWFLTALFGYYTHLFMDDELFDGWFT